jgi:hypothetical protein
MDSRLRGNDGIRWSNLGVIPAKAGIHAAGSTHVDTSTSELNSPRLSRGETITFTPHIPAGLNGVTFEIPTQRGKIRVCGNNDHVTIEEKRLWVPPQHPEIIPLVIS